MPDTSLASLDRDPRGVTSTFQAIVLVALVTVTVAGASYVVLGVVLVDDSPEVERVKIHVSESGVTLTPMIADPLPAAEVEVSISRSRGDPASVTIEDVARASMEANFDRYVAVASSSSPDPGAPIAGVESALGRNADAPTEATWDAGQPLHVATNPDFVREGDVLTIQIVDRQHRTLLVEKDLRVTALPKTVIVDVNRQPGDDGDPVPPDSGGPGSSVDRSKSGGVIDLGERWDRPGSRSVAPRGRESVVARARRGGDGGAGGGSSASGSVSGSAAGSGDSTGDAGGADIDCGVCSIRSPGGGDGGSGGGSVGGGGDPGTIDGPGGGDAGIDMIDASQGQGTFVTNGDGGDLMVPDGDGGMTVVMTEETFEEIAGSETGTIKASDAPSATRQRIESNAEHLNDPRVPSEYHGPSAHEVGDGGVDNSDAHTPGSADGSVGGPEIDLSNLSEKIEDINP